MYLILVIIMLVNTIVPNFNWTEDDVKMIGDVGWLENSSTGDTEEDNIACILLTMIVVKNRVDSGKWGGDTIKDVVYAKGQYATKTKNNIGKTDTPEWVYELARELLTYGSNVPDYVVYQSNQPRLGTVWKIIDGEYFATSKGHYMEGKDWKITTNKELYIEQRKQRLIKKIREFLEMDTILRIEG